jgi:hypothetical protein
MLKTTKVRKSIKPLDAADIAQMKKAIENVDCLQKIFLLHAE